MAEVSTGDIGPRLTAGARVRLPIPGGELHIDRPLPFLLLYRRTLHVGDAGTGELVAGEASWLVMDGDPDLQPTLSEVLGEVVGAQRSRFGSFLLVELWASENAARESGLGFRILAPTHNTPASMLEELENALVGMSLDNGPVDVRIEYIDEWAPPELLPVEVEGPFCHIGIEVPPAYRDHVTGDVDPFELRTLSKEISRALRRGLYVFAHDYTPLRPEHFHELGPRATTEPMYDVDRQIAAIATSFDLLLHVTPVNAVAAAEEFFASGLRAPPEFLYRSRTLDPDLVKRSLYAVPVEHIEDPALAHIFIEKRRELSHQLTLVGDRNTRRFLPGSRALYGDPEPALIELAEQILQGVPSEAPAHRLIPVEVVAARAREELSLYRSMDSTLAGEVEIRSDVPGVMVSQGNLLLGHEVRIPEERLEPLIAHELGTHMLTHHNGKHQPFQELHAGMAGYEALQEGLAVLWEYLVGGLGPDRLRLLAARVLAAVAVCDGAEFLETFRLLHEERGFPADAAFAIAMRVHRGGGFVKDVVYLRGLSQVLDYLAGGHPFERLHLGKVALEHLDVVEELQWRQVLVAPRLLPRQMDRDDVRERLRRCADGISVLDLVSQRRP